MPNDREVIFEIRRVGAFAKTSAIDVASGTEVSVSGPATSDDALLRQLALRRLDQVLRTRAGASAGTTKRERDGGWKA